MKTLLAALVTLTATLGPSLAQEPYPARPVMLVVPQPPGGTNDFIARIVADKMHEQVPGGRFVVENRAGAGGNIGTAFAARATPDGYTLLLTISATQAISPALYSKPNFDPVADFEPITLLARTGFVLVAHPSLKIASVNDLLAMGKSGGEIQYGSAGNGTMNHLLGEMLRSKTGLKLVHVPYRGVGPMLNDMLGGHATLGFASIPSVLPYLRSGALVPLAVSSAQRDPALPDVPTVGESVPGFEGDLWVALFAPKGTPKAVRDTLHAAATKALEDPAVKEKLATQGARVETSTPEELEAILKQDLAKWGQVVKESGAKVD